MVIVKSLSFHLGRRQLLKLGCTSAISSGIPKNVKFIVYMLTILRNIVHFKLPISPHYLSEKFIVFFFVCEFFLFIVSHCFQHCTGHITLGSFMDRENQHTHLVKILYRTLPIIGDQLPTIPHKFQGLNRRPQRWKASVLLLLQRAPPPCVRVKSM